jgi:hypothetical protein
MSLQPLNYLRAATEELRRQWIPAMTRLHPEDARICDEVLAEAAAAPKFLLPKGGRIFNDKLRGLPDDLKLPYPSIVIEYEASDAKDGLVEAAFGAENSASAPKRIVLAQEVEGWIHVHSLVQLRTDDRTFWIMQPYAAAIRKVEDSQATPELPDLKVGTVIDGLEVITFPTGNIAPERIGPDWRRNAYCDLMDECSATLELVEALSCINVTHEALPARKPNKNALKRGALPFDEYRVLVIKEHERSATTRLDPNSTHRSPREHLRRGHIRRLPDGRKVWVNPTIVNAGTSGKITTTYDVRRTA